jgi:uncharacterized membrane protein YqjE
VSDYKTRDLQGGDGRNGKSAGQLVKEVTEDLSTLVRKEIELAKQELGSAVGEKVTGVVLIAIVALFGLFALMFLLLALRDGLIEFMAPWAADLVTVAVLGLLGLICVLIAKSKLKTPIKADLTKQTIKDDVEMAKSFGRRNESDNVMGGQ